MRLMANKPNRTGRGYTPRFYQLFHWMTDCPAWRDLDAVSRALYLHLAKRYAGPGRNNGRLPYSVREGATELKIGVATAARALAKLTDHGFIVPVVKGAFSLKKRHATEWRLTEFPCDVTGNPLATKDFMRWQPSQPPCNGRGNKIHDHSMSAGTLATALLTGALARQPLHQPSQASGTGKLEVSHHRYQHDQHLGPTVSPQVSSEGQSGSKVSLRLLNSLTTNTDSPKTDTGF
jgi:hypothetical protein